MSTTIIMPQLGESVAEGVIGKWLKQEGEQIGKDEPIVEVITDKVNAEIPAPVAGVLERISAAEGVVVAVGQEIAFLASEADQKTSGSTTAQSARASAGAETVVAMAAPEQIGERSS